MSTPAGEAPVDESAFGIYVHVPYCRAICPYCDFNVYVAKGAAWDALATAMGRELDARAGRFSGRQVRSVYFGGGTPSLAPVAFVERLLGNVSGLFAVSSDAEITLEVDPGTLDADGFAARRALGINRISLGWQSSHDELLRRLGRTHSAADGEAAFSAARRAGFANVSVDLIFAVPGQTLVHLERDLDRVLAFAPEHVSLYALTYHEGTPFHLWRDAGRLQPITDELEVEMMELIERRLCAVGYLHYEVSNYARPGLLSRHNSLYWAGGEYLGIGPGAHGFWREGWQKGGRWESRRQPGPYIEAAGRGDGFDEWSEELSARQLLAERMLVGMRRAVGVDIAALALGAYASEFEKASAEVVRRGWAERRGSRLVPTHNGLLRADEVAALFF